MMTTVSSEQKRGSDEISSEWDEFDLPEHHNKRFIFDIPPPEDRECDFGRWHILLRAADHSYRVWNRETGVEEQGPFTSVTAFGESLFPEFDANTAGCLGTQMHSVMEVLLSRPGPYMCNFTIPGPRTCEHGRHAGPDSVVAMDAHVHPLLSSFERRGLSVIALEQCVYIPGLRMAGTIDAIFRDANSGKLLIYDWKRRPDFTTVNNFGERGFAGTPVADLPKCHLASAIVQLNLYREAWRRELGEDASELHIVGIHPTLGSFTDHPIPVDGLRTAALLAHRMKQLAGQR